MAVNPLFAATDNPFAIVSRSSNPGSPRETEVSNQPGETSKFSKLISSKSDAFSKSCFCFVNEHLQLEIFKNIFYPLIHQTYFTQENIWSSSGPRFCTSAQLCSCTSPCLCASTLFCATTKPCACTSAGPTPRLSWPSFKMSVFVVRTSCNNNENTNYHQHAHRQGRRGHHIGLI